MDKERGFTFKMIDIVMPLVEAISFQLNKELKSVKINSLEVVVGILHKRIHSNLISIRAFVVDEKNIYPASPIILFRAISLDYMLLVYLGIRLKELEGTAYKWKNEISLNMQKELDILLNDQLVRLYKDGYELIGVEFENETEYEEWVSKVRQLLPSEYHYIDRKTEGFNFHSPTKLFRIIKNSLSKNEFDTNVKRIWGFYSSYSKTDHFGLMSLVLERKSAEDFIKELRLGLLYIVNALEIVGVTFMQVETFRAMLQQIEHDLDALGEP